MFATPGSKGITRQIRPKWAIFRLNPHKTTTYASGKVPLQIHMGTMQKDQFHVLNGGFHFSWGSMVTYGGMGTSWVLCGCGSKPMGSHFGVGEFATILEPILVTNSTILGVCAPPILIYFSGWIGMFIRGTIWLLSHGHVSFRASLRSSSRFRSVQQRLTSTRSMTGASMAFLKPSGTSMCPSGGGGTSSIVLIGICVPLRKIDGPGR